MPQFEVNLTLTLDSDSGELAESEVHSAFSLLSHQFPHWHSVATRTVTEVTEVTVTRGKGRPKSSS